MVLAWYYYILDLRNIDMRRQIETEYGLSDIYQTEVIPGAPVAVVATGFVGTLEHSIPIAKALARQGIEAVTFSQPTNYPNTDINPIDRYASVVTSVFEWVCSDREERSIHATATSLGAAAVARAAASWPEQLTSRVISFNFHESAGMVDGQNIENILTTSLRRGASHLASAALDNLPLVDRLPVVGRSAERRIISGESPKALLGRLARTYTASALRIALHPDLSVHEAHAALSYDLGADIKQIPATKPILLIAAGNDELFPINDFLRHYSELGRPNTHLGVIADGDAYHNSYWMYPDCTANIAASFIRWAEKSR
jgi:alpha-beta hydrolase superfamily lysophospholipase